MLSPAILDAYQHEIAELDRIFSEQLYIDETGNTINLNDILRYFELAELIEGKKIDSFTNLDCQKYKYLRPPISEIRIRYLDSDIFT